MFTVNDIENNENHSTDNKHDDIWNYEIRDEVVANFWIFYWLNLTVLGCYWWWEQSKGHQQNGKRFS